MSARTPWLDYTPDWDVPMPEGVERHSLEWYLRRSRRIAAERRSVVAEAERITRAAAH